MADDEAWFAERAAARAARAAEREARKKQEDKEASQFEERHAKRRETRDRIDETIAKAESDAKVKSVTRGSDNTAESEAARRKIAEEEEKRRKERETARQEREAKLEAQRIEAAKAAEEEARARKEKEAERARAREDAERAQEEARKVEAAKKEVARQARILAQKEAEAEEQRKREAEKAKREEERKKREEEDLAKANAEAERKAAEKKAAEDARKAAEREATERAEAEREAKLKAREEQKQREIADKKKREDEAAAAAAEKKRKDEEAAAEKKRIDDEKAAAAAAKAEAEKKRKDDEAAALAAAAEKKRIEDEQTAAAKKRIDDEKAAAAAVQAENKRKDEEAAAAAIAAAAEKKRLEDEEAAAEKKRKEQDEAAAAELKRKTDEEAAEKKRLAEAETAAVEAAAAEKKRKDDGQAAAEAEAKRLQEEAAEKARLEEQAKADEKARAEAAEVARIEAEEKSKAEAEHKKKEEQRLAAEAKELREIEEEEKRIAEEEALLAAEKSKDTSKTNQTAEIDDELRRLEEEEALLKADEERLMREEAESKQKDGVSDEDDLLLDEEEEEAKRLKAEEDALKAEEEALLKEEEEEKARLIAEEEAELAREEAELEAMKQKQEHERLEREAQRKKDEEAENARIEAQLLAEEKAAQEALKQQQEAAALKKKQEDEAAAKKQRDEDEAKAKLEAQRVAEEQAAQAALKKKEEEAALAAAEEKKKKEEEEAAKAAAAKAAQPPEATAAPVATSGASKKAAFLAALNNKIGLGGPPPKAKPAVVVEEAPPQSVEAPASVPAESSSSHLTHLTQNRAKGPNRKHRATMAGLKLRMGADGATSLFVGEVQATAHVDGATTDSNDAASASTPVAEAPVAEPVKKVPAGAKGMPGMSMGGLMAAINKNQERRASTAAGPTPSSPGNAADGDSVSSSGPAAALPPVRLIQVRGKGKEIAVRLVEPSIKGLSHDCAYILENVKTGAIFVWSGYSANKMQITKCLDVVTRINRGEHGGRAQISNLKAGEETNEFWQTLGVTEVTPTLVKTIAQTSSLPVVPDTLYRLDPTDTSFILFEMASETKNLERGLLWADACYILDSGYEVRVWIGKSSPKEMRDAALSQAHNVLNKKIASSGEERPAWARFVYKEADRGETALFTDKFGSWPAEYRPKVAAAPPSRARAMTALPAPTVNSATSTPTNSPQKPVVKPTNSRMVPYDGTTMLAIERPAAADKILPDEGVHGAIRVWIQQGFEKKPLPKWHVGIFNDENCYLELYSWGMVGSERHMVYFWQGTTTSPNDQGAVAGLARDVNDHICKGAGQLVRVPQFHENEHFLLCHANQHQPYVSLSSRANKTFDGMQLRIIQVRGHSANDTRAHQIIADASLLNTNDVFLVILDTDGSVSPLEATADDTPYLAKAKSAFIWNGSNSNKFCREYSATLLSRLVGKSVAESAKVLEEGSETPAFWKMFEQKAGFDGYFKIKLSDFALKIYMCTASTSDGFKIGRIWDYSNFDICSDRVLIVEDAAHHVFVWLGSRSAEPERKLGLESSLSYAQSVSSPSPVSYSYEGHESLHFRSLFHGWIPKSKLDTKHVSGNGLVNDLLPQYSATYPLATIKDRANLPPTVDQAHLEYHLDPKDFNEAVKMTYEAFFNLPEWKRLEAKKSSPLF